MKAIKPLQSLGLHVFCHVILQKSDLIYNRKNVSRATNEHNLKIFLQIVSRETNEHNMKK